MINSLIDYVSMKLLASLIGLILITIALVIYFSSRDWQTASRDSAGIAPGPAVTKEAVIQVYGADTWGWRGRFAIHSWIAAKRSGADHYVVYDVVGWRGYHNQSVMQIEQDVPDRYWYGARPEILVEHRGKGVDALIQQVDNAARNYPWQFSYKAFPGPNSNTFTAWIGQQVPDLKLKLPFSAIGSGYLDQAKSRH